MERVTKTGKGRKTMSDISVVDGKKIRYWNLKKNEWKYELADAYSCMVPVFPDKYCCYPVVDEFVSLTPQGLLCFRESYCWDGPSGPTIDTPSSMRGALKHDGLYQLMRAGVLDIKWREATDKVLRDTCKEDGMWGWRADWWYRAVRLAAGPAAKKGHDVAEDIETAP